MCTPRHSRTIVSVLVGTCGMLLAAGPAAGHVTLLRPNGGESLAVGSIFRIRWTIAITHDLQNWDLWYSTTGAGGPWITIALNRSPGSSAVGSIHTYNWTVPNNPSDQVRVRVRMDNSGTDYLDISNGNLTIECTVDTQCGKCETCDLVTGTCTKNVPNCCTSDAQCGKCELCDLAINTCFDGVPDCCTSDAECAPLSSKCVPSICDLASNSCVPDQKIPDCCASDAQCDDGDPCTDDFCITASNTCTNTNVCGACCLPDSTCADDYREENCLALSGAGNFLGIASFCRGPGKDCLPAPTVSEWGMAVLATLLLIGLTVKFRNRSTSTA